MKTNYLPTFIKDMKSLKSTSSYSAIKNLVFTDILAVQKKIPPYSLQPDREYH
jgi:hypothetical protein